MVGGGTMSQTLEIPDGIFDALKKAAEAGGTTPVEWIAARLAEVPAPSSTESKPRGTLADWFAGKVGLIRGDGPPRVSGREGEDFADYLEEKRRKGRL
jgi:hypothetical protein